MKKKNLENKAHRIADCRMYEAKRKTIYPVNMSIHPVAANGFRKSDNIKLVKTVNK